MQPGVRFEAAFVADIGDDDGDDVSDVRAELLGLTIKICCLIVGVSSIGKSARLTLMPESESTRQPEPRSLTPRPPPFLSGAEPLCLNVSL